MVTRSYGGAEVLTWSRTEKPPISPRQILVRVRASSVNPVDWKVRQGDVRIFSGLRPPLVLGADLAGEIVEVGAKVTDYAVGDQVYGMVRAFKGGAYAEYVAVTPENIAPLPSGLSFSEAACLPLVSLTIHQMLYSRAKLAAGQHVLVNGCCGGIGHIAVQMAKALGAEVTGVCSTRNLTVAKALGADNVIDYTQQNLLATQQTYDLFFDAAANQHFGAVRHLLRSKGIYISPIPSVANMIFSPIANKFRQQKNSYLWVEPDAEALRTITALVESGNLRPLIDRSYPIKQISDAHRYSESGRVVGKVALTFD
ncbi:MAG: NAD(P)-dependent alcohol dehydrogenase [Sandaracinaceae bacterium]|nr:NAD(P)-dependent alcohol dehydrogenase [Sandaracinaceae bacterium]MBK7152905.1 NAD(P)-dependent alcohol dehydrogenase [Sandaracinaceae bacterium]MBK8408062.1 NAD(P)-dependent alcohol dehydrogenase [Sandaracinaceae bacterium]MBK8593614.1 NAD(P)-dependent alcohol dehydrogenase [Sandaracinaceae bacterium]